MPEMPEAENICIALRGAIQGSILCKIDFFVDRLRRPLNKDSLRSACGRKLVNVYRVGKGIVFDFENYPIIVSLGMSGALLLHDLESPFQKHDRVSLFFKNFRLDFNDVRKFGMIEELSASVLLSCAPDPFSYKFDVKRFSSFVSRKSVKSLLTDGNMVSGIGNIYASEILFAAGIRPDRVSISLSDSEMNSIISESRNILQYAIRCGGSSLKDYKKPDGSIGDFQSRFKVYGRARKICFNCNTLVKRIRQSGRSSFFCESCQT